MSCKHERTTTIYCHWEGGFDVEPHDASTGDRAYSAEWCEECGAFQASTYVGNEWREPSSSKQPCFVPVALWTSEPEPVDPQSSLKSLESALHALASLDLNDVPYHLQEDLAHISHQAHAALEDIKKGTNHHD